MPRLWPDPRDNDSVNRWEILLVVVLCTVATLIVIAGYIRID